MRKKTYALAPPVRLRVGTADVSTAALFEGTDKSLRPNRNALAL